LKRTIYGAQNSENENNIPRNKILIEGGKPTSAKADPSNDPNEGSKGLEKPYNLYSQFFNRDSVDGKGLTLDGSVHFGMGNRWCSATETA
jgi:Zn-dependent metalloprotease